MPHFRLLDLDMTTGTIEDALDRLEGNQVAIEEIHLCLDRLDLDPEGRAIADEIRAELPAHRNFRNAWPAKWTSPSFKSDTNGYGVEARVATAVQRIRRR